MSEPDDGVTLPPHSDEMERGVLGCILLSPIESIEQCVEKIKAGPQAFFDLRHRVIYQEMLAMYDENLPVEFILLQQRMDDKLLLHDVGGIAYLNQLQDSVPSAANLPHYLDIVIEKWQLRNLVQACQSAIGRAYQCNGEIDSIIGDVEKKVLSIEKTGTKPTLDGEAVGQRMINDLERRYGLNGKLSGLDTGFPRLNYMTEGLQYGEQFVIGARPSQGKTALGLSIMAHCGFSGVPCLFVSLEMSIEAVMRRLCSMDTKVPLKKIRAGNYSDTDMAKFAGFNLKLRRSPIYFMDGVDGCGIREIGSRINRLVLKHGIKLVVVDYLQKIKPAEKQEKRTYEVAEVSGRLKSLAYDNNVAMITLAQLNRENVKGGGGKSEKGRAPRLSDLADSGQIERDADMVGLIHREENKTSLIIAKQRDGETGLIPLYFNAPYAQFENLENYEPEQ